MMRNPSCSSDLGEEAQKDPPIVVHEHAAKTRTKERESVRVCWWINSGFFLRLPFLLGLW